MKLRILAGMIVVLAAFLSGCDSGESARVDETRAKLVGTWLREIQTDAAKSRRVLVIGQDGKFTERASLVRPDGQSEHPDYAGEWSYDGTHFKRRYLQEGGRQYSGGKMRYATYQLLSLSNSQWVARDNVDGQEIVYQRVPEGTQP